MADLYGSQDVTIRNDDGTKVVTITTDGAKERLDVNAVLGAPSAVQNAQVLWTGNNAPYKANMWLPVAAYTVPTGYYFAPYLMQYSAGNSSSLVRSSEEVVFGSLNTNTNVFTDGVAYTSPKFVAYLELRMTQTCNTNMTITITYTNQSGTTGRTATIALVGSGPTQSMIYYTYLITLQSGDTGVRDITNISTSATGNGNFTIYGMIDILRDSADAAGVIYTDYPPLNSYIVPANAVVGLSVTSASTAVVDRYLALTGQIGVV